MPDYSEFIRAAIARNPPGDYNDALALAVVLRPETSQPDASEDILTATIKAVETDIQTLAAEMQREHFTTEELAHKKTERAKLNRELDTFKEIRSEHP